MWNRNNSGTAAEGYSAIPMSDMVEPGTTPRSAPAVIAAAPSSQRRVSLRQPLLGACV